MTAVTGETGAGKTLVVEAIELLVGGRADPGWSAPAPTRPWSRAASSSTTTRSSCAAVVPATGRSRAYVDGHLASLAELAERGATLVDLHGQHDHQSLLTPAVQRRALDRFGGIDLEPLRAARKRAGRHRRALGGPRRRRARPGPRDRPAALPGRRARRPPRSTIADEDDRARATRRSCSPTPPATASGAAAAVERARPATAARSTRVAVAARRARRPAAVRRRRRAAWRGVAAELADVAAELRQRGEVDRGRPRAAGRGRRRAASCSRSCAASTATTLAEVIEWRDAAPRRASPTSRATTPRAAAPRRSSAPRRVAELARERGRGGAPRAGRGAPARWPPRWRPSSPTWPCPRPGSRSRSTASAGRDVVLPVRRQPGHGPAAAGQGRLRRRAGPGDAGPAPGAHRGPAGAGVRRGRRRHRRRRPPWPSAARSAPIAGDHQVLVVTHLAQVAAWADAQRGGRQAGVDGDTTVTTVGGGRPARTGSPSWPACCRAPRTRQRPATTPRELLAAAAHRPSTPTPAAPCWTRSRSRRARSLAGNRVVSRGGRAARGRGRR